MPGEDTGHVPFTLRRSPCHVALQLLIFNPESRRENTAGTVSHSSKLKNLRRRSLEPLICGLGGGGRHTTPHIGIGSVNLKRVGMSRNFLNFSQGKRPVKTKMPRAHKAHLKSYSILDTLKKV